MKLVYSLQFVVNRVQKVLCIFRLKAKSYQLSAKDGFTLIEIMVASALFAIVMTVTIGALLSLVDANRKAQAVQSVVNNLNIALDGMVRNMRMGSKYHCGPGSVSNPRDCSNFGASSVAFEPFERTQGGAQWIYWFEVDSDGIGRIYRSITGSKSNKIPITSSNVNIENMTFYVVGATVQNKQPKIVITVKGVAGIDQKIKTRFNIQTMASQRLLDI